MSQPVYHCPQEGMTLPVCIEQAARLDAGLRPKDISSNQDGGDCFTTTVTTGGGFVTITPKTYFPGQYPSTLTFADSGGVLPAPIKLKPEFKPMDFAGPFVLVIIALCVAALSATWIWNTVAYVKMAKRRAKHDREMDRYDSYKPPVEPRDDPEQP